MTEGAQFKLSCEYPLSCCRCRPNGARWLAQSWAEGPPVQHTSLCGIGRSKSVGWS